MNKYEKETKRITSIEEIKNRAERIVELPGWDEAPFICKVKRVGILGLATKNKIPNTLMSLAMDMFNKKVDAKNVNMADMIEMFEIIAEETLVEPSLQDLKDNGIELTDIQLMAIFNFSQRGVTKIAHFPDKLQDNDGHKNNPDVRGKTK